MASGDAIDRIEKTDAASNADSGEGFRGLNVSCLAEPGKIGQDVAFEELLRLHSKQIFRTIYRITKNREDAEDAMQDAFLKAFVHIKNFDNRSQLSTWLTRIAINSALLIVRKKRSAAGRLRDIGDDSRSFDPATIPDRAPGPEAKYAQRERRAMIRIAVRALPPKVRDAVVLQRLQELSVTETADKLGLSLAAAKSRLFRAKAALHKSLSPAFFQRGISNSDWSAFLKPRRSVLS